MHNGLVCQQKACVWHQLYTYRCCIHRPLRCTYGWLVDVAACPVPTHGGLLFVAGFGPRGRKKELHEFRFARVRGLTLPSPPGVGGQGLGQDDLLVRDIGSALMDECEGGSRGPGTGQPGAIAVQLCNWGRRL
eukprot:372692-Pelagomonas_calceolata.AAC.10